MNTRKIVLSILGVLLIAGALFGAKLMIDSNVKEVPEVNKTVKSVFVDTVENRLVPIVVPANGNLTALNRTEIFSEVEGVFSGSSKAFRPGQKYSRGQVLLRINADEYRATVLSAKSDLYNSITAIMPDLRFDYPDIYEKWQSYLQNFDVNKAVPPLPETENDQEKFFITGRGIVSAYYNIKNMEERLGKFVITAPFNGVLTEALVNPGTLIRPGQKLGEFIDPGVYELEVAIPKKFSNLLVEGEEVSMYSLDSQEKYVGKVSRINSRVNQSTQSIQVFIEVENEKLSEGMYLEARLNAKQEENAIEIPRELLVDRSKVYIVRDSLLDLVEVEPVYFGDSRVVIKGLEDGTSILSATVPGAYSGMLVKVEGEKEITNSSVE